MSTLPWRPRIVYGSGPTTLDLSWPMMPPVPDDGEVGGRDIAAAGVPAAYVVREDEMLDVTLRFFEHEWPDVQAFIRSEKNPASTFSFYPDQTDLAHVYTCYLQNPAAGENTRPQRGEHFGTYQLAIKLRSITGAFDVRYWEDVVES